MKSNGFLCLSFAIGLLCCSSQSYGQNKPATIQLGTHELSLGMPKDTVIASLSEDFRLDKAEDSDFWGVVEKGERPKSVGFLSFGKGKLTYASRPWWRSGMSQIQAVNGAISQLVREGKTHCTIAADTRREPDKVMEITWISCGEKTLKFISGSFSEDNKWVDITEELGSM